jgi:ribosomal protein L30/L7E
MHKTVRLQETPAIRGMLRQVGYLLTIREIPEGEA